MKQTEVAQLMDSLLAAGLLEQNEIEPFRPIVQLTNRGLEVMAGRVDEPLSLSVSDLLWRKIGGSTKQKAAKPAAEMSAERPPQQVATSEAPTCNPASVPETSPTSEEVKPGALEPGAVKQSAGPESVALANSQPSHYWTWRLLAAGLAPAECAAARGFSEDVVLDHALRAADGGLEIDASWFLSQDKIAAIRTVIGDAPLERIRPLLGKLPRGTRYEHVQLVLKSR
jgi:hypothetical protein